MEAILALEDGRVFRGRSFGAPGERIGEVVFHTGMTGYQEILTDPSYHGQIIAMTSPEIGNYGVNPGDGESHRPWAEGLVVRECSPWPSNWRATHSLSQYLKEHEIPALSEVDTRALTRHLRSRGAMRGALSTVDRDAESLVAKARNAPRIDQLDLVGRVSCAERYDWSEPRDPAWRTDLGLPEPSRRRRLVAFDFGVKRNSLRLLSECGFDVIVVPARTQAEEVLAAAPDAVFLSNGPGDPATLTGPIETVRSLIGLVPIFGICLGHQLAALALGGKTFKLKFGHHGANHPVKDLRTGSVAVTSQNHGYSVDPASLPRGARMTHISLNDQTCEGFQDREARVMAIQFHPEAAPGPHDAHPLFREFLAMVGGFDRGAEPSLEAQT